jgi:nitroreductase
VADFEQILRTTFAGRRFTDAPVTDEDVAAVLDVARFASSGGNRQPWRVVAIRDTDTKRAVLGCGTEALRRYTAQQRAGESPYNSVVPSRVTDADVAGVPDDAVAWYVGLAAAPVVLVIGVELRLVASFDARLDRVGVVSGASIYPFVHNVLLAARARGLSGVLTTFAVAGEASVRELLALPASVAVAAVVPLGHPAKVIRKLTREPVAEFARWESWAGAPVTGP